MSIWEKMNDLTRGKTKVEAEKEVELSRAQIGDNISGVISNVRKEGYGFITSEQLSFERIFFHWTGLKQDTLRFPELRKRMRVEFQLIKAQYRPGYQAIKIKVLE